MIWCSRPGVLRAIKLSLVFSLFLLVVPSERKTRADDTASSTDIAVDCGTLALGALLLLEGHKTDPQELLGRLLPSTEVGPSLLELRDAAAACGMNLKGVRLKRDKRAIDRPMIVFLERAQHGHYQVVRPVGHTGELAQVIDSNLAPYVLDKHALMEAPEWTGIALVPDRRPCWPIRIASALIGAPALLGLCWFGLSRLRQTRTRSLVSTF